MKEKRKKKRGNPFNSCYHYHLDGNDIKEENEGGNLGTFSAIN